MWDRTRDFFLFLELKHYSHFALSCVHFFIDFRSFPKSNFDDEAWLPWLQKETLKTILR